MTLGHRAQRGEKNGMPFQISTSAVTRPEPAERAATACVRGNTA